MLHIAELQAELQLRDARIEELLADLDKAQRLVAEMREQSTDDLAGLRFSDLVNKRIISSRSDLNRKQRELGFPLPVKTGARTAWWFESEVLAWLRWRASLRDPDTTAQKQAKAPDSISRSAGAFSLPPSHRAATAREKRNRNGRRGKY
jgi:predicted DNA-binding transcriptional regulator AlpA